MNREVENTAVVCIMLAATETKEFVGFAMLDGVCIVQLKRPIK